MKHLRHENYENGLYNSIRYPNNKRFLLWTSRTDFDELTKLDKVQTLDVLCQIAAL